MAVEVMGEWLKGWASGAFALSLSHPEKMAAANPSVANSVVNNSLVRNAAVLVKHRLPSVTVASTATPNAVLRTGLPAISDRHHLVKICPPSTRG
jgi:hypothetical protein